MERRIDPGTLQVYKWIAFGLVVAPLLATIIYATTNTQRTPLVAAMSGAMVGLAPFACGALVGFLFGIPRTLTGDPVRRSEGSTPESRQIRHGVNTNLEQISDWLTKILVGVGLTQLATIPERLESLSEHLAPSMGNRPEVVTAVVVYFLVAGFLGFYVFMRMALAPAFEDADNGPSPGAVDRLSEPPTSPDKSRLRFDTRDVTELLRYRFRDMTTKAQKLAWVRAKVDEEDLEDAIPAAEETLRAYPRDPRAVEALMLALLYDVDHAPENAIRAVHVARGYLDGKPKKRDARVWAYLALALGQLYWARKEEQVKSEALEAASTAIKLDDSLRGYLRHFANPDNDDDDLAELAKDTPQVRQLLGISD